MKFDVEISDFIDEISTSVLEDELQERKEFASKDPDSAIRRERNRDDYEITVDIPVYNYGLVDRSDIKLGAYFGTGDMLDYLEKQGYELIGKDNHPAFNIMHNWIDNAPKWNIKGFLCDICGVPHTIGNDDLMKELRSKIE